MKTFLIARLSLLALVFGLSISLANAQTALYTEDATLPATGYWTIETSPAHRDYSIIRFYTAEHENIYEERLNDVCLDPSKGTAKCRRTARMLSSAVAQVQHTRTSSLVANGLGLQRRVQRAYAAR